MKREQKLLRYHNNNGFSKFTFSGVLCVLLVFNLTNGIDVKETEERIDAYKKENQDVIRKNKSKLVIWVHYLQLLTFDTSSGSGVKLSAMELYMVWRPLSLYQVTCYKIGGCRA